MAVIRSKYLLWGWTLPACLWKPLGCQACEAGNSDSDIGTLHYTLALVKENVTTQPRLSLENRRFSLGLSIQLPVVPVVLQDTLDIAIGLRKGDRLDKAIAIANIKPL